MITRAQQDLSLIRHRRPKVMDDLCFKTSLYLSARIEFIGRTKPTKKDFKKLIQCLELQLQYFDDAASGEEGV